MKMDKAGQYGEPWREYDPENLIAIYDRDGIYVTSITAPSKKQISRYFRIVSCVNALASLSDEQLSQDPIAKAREALEDARKRLVGAGMFGGDEPINAALALLGDKP